MLEKLYGELMNLRVIRKKAELFRGKRFPVDGFVRIGGEPYWIQDGEAHYLYILEEVSERCFLHQPGTLKDCALAAMALVDMDKVDKIVAIETMALPICSVLAVMAGKPMAIVGKRRYVDDITGREPMWQIEIAKRTGYAVSYMYANALLPRDNVFIYEPIISTGGTLCAVIKALEGRGIAIVDAMAVIEKVDYQGVERVKRETGHDVKTLLQVRLINVKETDGFGCPTGTEVVKTPYLRRAEEWAREARRQPIHAGTARFR